MSSNPTKPPRTNRGAQSAPPTFEPVPFFLIDWVGVTFPESALSMVLEMIGGDWRDQKRGAQGYRSCKALGGIRLLYDGAPGMGCHLEMTGQACREFEGLPTFQGWGVFLAFCAGVQAKWSRLDAAWNDRTPEPSGLLDLETIKAHVRRGWLVARFKGCRIVEGYDTKGNETGCTVYLGSPDSDMQLRIYDKVAETLAKRKVQLPGHWVRVELQGRDEQAQRMADMMLAPDGPERLAAALLGYVDFKEPGTSPQKTRWKSSPWWTGFLRVAEKEKMGTMPKVRTLDTVAQWVSKQVAPSLALLIEACGGDLTPLLRLIETGRARMNTALLDSVGTAPEGSESGTAPEGLTLATMIDTVSSDAELQAAITELAILEMHGQNRTPERIALAHKQRAAQARQIGQEAAERHDWMTHKAARVVEAKANIKARLVLQGKD